VSRRKQPRVASSTLPRRQPARRVPLIGGRRPIGALCVSGQCWFMRRGGIGWLLDSRHVGRVTPVGGAAVLRAGDGARVLVVDDDPAARRAARGLLEAARLLVVA
jgi:hypothetical protein